MKTIYLIGCSAKKSSFAQPAIDLYAGPLFLLQKEYVARLIGAAVLTDCFILSAKHGLVPATKELKPYEQRFQDAEHRYVWESVVYNQLIRTLPNEPLKIVVFAGRQYRGWIRWVQLKCPDWRFEVLLNGFKIGQQKQQMREMIDGLPEHPDISLEAMLASFSKAVPNV